jgi:hypothetical protein
MAGVLRDGRCLTLQSGLWSRTPTLRDWPAQTGSQNSSFAGFALRSQGLFSALATPTGAVGRARWTLRKQVPVFTSHSVPKGVQHAVHGLACFCCRDLLFPFSRCILGGGAYRPSSWRSKVSFASTAFINLRMGRSLPCLFFYIISTILFLLLEPSMGLLVVF